MKLKLDEAGHVIVENGMPVYEHEDGSAKPHDASKTMATLKRFGEGEKSWRERATKAEAAVANFAGIDDPEAARNALQTVASMDGKHKLDLERVRGETVKQYQARIDAAEARTKALEANLHRAVVGGAIAQSKFLADETVWTADVAEAMYAKDISVDEKGRFVGKDASGAVVYSRTNHGEPADVDEFLQIRIEAHPRKESILKANQKAGTGAKPGTQGNGAQKQTITRSEFDLKSPPERSALLKAGVVPVD